MKKLLLILFLTGCSTSVDIEEYRANIRIEGEKVYMTHTEYQVPRNIKLNFQHVSLGQGAYGITFTREYVITHAGLPYDDLCEGSLGC